MSIDARRTTTKGGDPRLIVTVTGAHDVYRFADHLKRGQCEFADVGMDTMRYLKRKMGKAGFDWIYRYMHGDGGYR